MATRLPRRPTPTLHLPSLFTTSSPSQLSQRPSHTPLSLTPSRAATLIRRPRRPYAFTQLVQLSDGSTYTVRTASPLALYKSTKDTRNHALWNPNEKSLQNVEVDEAGKLAAFRERFGRGWDAGVEDTSASAGGTGAKDDAGSTSASGAGTVEGSGSGSGRKDRGGSDDALADLIAGYAVGMPELPSRPPPSRKDKDKKD